MQDAMKNYGSYKVSDSFLFTHYSFIHSFIFVKTKAIEAPTCGVDTFINVIM